LPRFAQQTTPAHCVRCLVCLASLSKLYKNKIYIFNNAEKSGAYHIVLSCFYDTDFCLDDLRAKACVYHHKSFCCGNCFVYNSASRSPLQYVAQAGLEYDFIMRRAEQQFNSKSSQHDKLQICAAMECHKPVI
jgi:hypothetical protein